MAIRYLPYGFGSEDTLQVVNKNALALDGIDTSIATLETSVAALDTAVDALAPIPAQVAVVETQLGPTGTATIPNGATSVNVNHGHGSSSYTVSAVPTNDLGAGQRFWISGKGSTSFTINLAGAAAGAKLFEWIVRGN